MEITCNNIIAWKVDGEEYQSRKEDGLPPLTEGIRERLSGEQVNVLVAALRRGYAKIDRVGDTRLRVIPRKWKPGMNFWLIDGGEILLKFSRS